MKIDDYYAVESPNGMYIRFGNPYKFTCELNLWYITGTMNQRDFRKMIKLIIWACVYPDVIMDAFAILENSFLITIKLSKSAPKNMKYLQEVKAKYELQ